ncbi:MAG: hypothetical protein BGP16_12815 [Sphingobium sp. 66-54]|nr:MAG: hypothetical protein BGP16_12815 [Sphingobium sp. 66-54]
MTGKKAKLEREVRHVLQGWADWHTRVDSDDENCAYLNGDGWDDADALACHTRDLLARLAAAPGDGTPPTVPPSASAAAVPGGNVPPPPGTIFMGSDWRSRA